MKKLSLFLAILLILSMLAPIVVRAEGHGNAWVYDEPNVVSDETEEYIRNLNESVFIGYKEKPQLAFIVINDLPYNIDDYKLDMFNEYGVGTKEENHGMLFVFAINDREYALEIGDGFKKGSLLRKDLETDFITSEMKQSLRDGNYDIVVKQVAEHLARMMADEENGVYAAKEEEKAIRDAEFEAQSKKVAGIALIVLLSALGLVAFGIFASWLFKRISIARAINASMDKYSRHVALLKMDNKILKKLAFEEFENKDAEYVHEHMMYFLYNHFIYEQEALLDKRNLANKSNLYRAHLSNRNTINTFAAMQIVGIDMIILEVDAAEEKRKSTQNTNINLVEKFLEDNLHRVENKAIVDKLTSRFEGKKLDSRLVTIDELEEHFTKTMSALNFEYEFDKFCEENKDKIDPKYFDRNDFYKTVQSTPNYANYHYSHTYNRNWMMHFLMIHMASQRRQVEARERREREEREARERRRREEAARKQRQQMQNHNSSFGSGFGGGFSSGGGFKGGW